MASSRIEFGKRLKARREECGLTQERLGQLMGVKQKNISEWEGGQTEPEDIERLVLLAETLQCGVGWLVNGELPKPGTYQATLGDELAEVIVQKIPHRRVPTEAELDRAERAEKKRKGRRA